MKYMLLRLLLIPLFTIIINVHSIVSAAGYLSINTTSTLSEQIFDFKGLKKLSAMTYVTGINRYAAAPKAAIAITMPPELTGSRKQVLAGSTTSLSLINVFSQNVFFMIIVLFSVILNAILYGEKRRTAGLIKGLQADRDDKAFCLEIANEERDWLVKEIHHRVKNNLQVVMSLLNTQSFYLTNEEAIKAIRNSQHRMYAISLVHQKLYQSDSLSSVDMVHYTYELLEYLQDEFENADNIDFQLEMVPLSLDVSMAVPFGLIINEAISNALKYAFPSKSEGRVIISLKSSDQLNYSFTIADNGIGLGNNVDQSPSSSFGKNLMAGLANQLGGVYEVTDKNGVEILVKFNNKPFQESKIS